MGQGAGQDLERVYVLEWRDGTRCDTNANLLKSCGLISHAYLFVTALCYKHCDTY
jgi:hypothetical protein